MLARLLRRATATSRTLVQALRRRHEAATEPAASMLVTGALTDLARDKPALIAANALLRQQLLILRRCVKRPPSTATDRALLVLLASRVRAWRSALLLVQPDTLSRWHRQLFRGFWRRQSRATVVLAENSIPATSLETSCFQALRFPLRIR